MAASGMMPEEMVVQILTRLHPRSLMRFKCVRKSWHALINDPEFVSRHLHSYNDVSSSTRILFKRTMPKETETTKEEVAFSFPDLPNDSDADFDNLDSATEKLKKSLLSDKILMITNDERISFIQPQTGKG